MEKLEYFLEGNKHLFTSSLISEGFLISYFENTSSDQSDARAVKTGAAAAWMRLFLVTIRSQKRFGYKIDCLGPIALGLV